MQNVLEHTKRLRDLKQSLLLQHGYMSKNTQRNMTILFCFQNENVRKWCIIYTSPNCGVAGTSSDKKSL